MSAGWGLCRSNSIDWSFGPKGQRSSSPGQRPGTRGHHLPRPGKGSAVVSQSSGSEVQLRCPFRAYKNTPLKPRRCPGLTASALRAEKCAGLQFWCRIYRLTDKVQEILYSHIASPPGNENQATYSYLPFSLPMYLPTGRTNFPRSLFR